MSYSAEIKTQNDKLDGYAWLINDSFTIQAPLSSVIPHLMRNDGDLNLELKALVRLFK